MRPRDMATADSHSVQSFAIIKNTGHENFVIGRFNTMRLACVQSPPPLPQTPLLRFFLRGKAEGLNKVLAFTVIGQFFSVTVNKKVKNSFFCFKELNIKKPLFLYL